MKISLIVPAVNHAPTHRPRACVYCQGPILHRHGTLTKPLRDHKLEEVIIQCYKCVSCGRTFRHYPAGITQKSQTQRTVVLAALMYGLGLSCSAASHLLGALGCRIAKMSVWRDAQEAGEALSREKRRPAGRVRVIGADETVYKVKGKEVVVGFVVNAQNGRTLGFKVLFEGDARAFRGWLEPYARALGAEILVTDDNDSYAIAASELGLEHQLCIAHVRKYVAKRSKSILEQAKKEWKEEEEEGERLARLRQDLGRVEQLVDELKEEGANELRQLHLEYLWARPPDSGQAASAGYRMRMLTLELWNKWGKLRVHLRRPELGLDGTNNATERAIGKSKVRYKTMRGYKSEEGMINGIALTQWLYSGEDEHDLAKEMVAAA